MHPSSHTSYYQKSFFPTTIVEWNSLQSSMIDSANIDIFTNQLLDL